MNDSNVFFFASSNNDENHEDIVSLVNYLGGKILLSADKSAYLAYIPDVMIGYIENHHRITALYRNGEDVPYNNYDGDVYKLIDAWNTEKVEQDIRSLVKTENKRFM